MHTIARAGWRMHFNSDFSGTAQLHGEELDPADHIQFPAELLIEIERRCMEKLADWADDLGNDADGWSIARELRKRAEALKTPAP